MAALAAGCAEPRTLLLVAISAAPQVVVTTLTVTVSVGSGGSASEPLRSSGGPPQLPSTLKVILPDVIQSVTVTLTGLDDAGRTLGATMTIVSVPHEQREMALTVGEIAGTDGGIDTDAGLVDSGGLPMCGCFKGDNVAVCGSALPGYQALNHCDVAPLPGHTSDLLVCAAGKWTLYKLCPKGCMLSPPPPNNPDVCAP